MVSTCLCILTARARDTGLAAESGVAEEIALKAFGDHLADQLAPDLSDDKVAALVSQKDFLLKHGFISRDFNIEKFIVRGPLAEANRIVGSHSRLACSRWLFGSALQGSVVPATGKIFNGATTMRAATRWPTLRD